jgi:exonuclease SbcD
VEVHSHDEALALLSARIQADNLAAGNRRTVVISHCFLDGGEESESERPLSVGGADRVSPQHFLPFHYTALGHLHGPQYKGAEHIRYSGSILKYSFSEQHQKKSVTLVDMDADGHCAIEKIPLQPLRDMRTVEGTFDDILQQGRSDPHADDYLLVRLTDRQAIYDVMGKLREVYRNVLHLERPGLQRDSEQPLSHREHLQRSEQAMFADFYQQVKGEPLSAPQQSLLATIIDQLNTEV